MPTQPCARAAFAVSSPKWPTLPPGVVETSTESGVSRSKTSRYGRMRTMPSSQPTRGMSWPSTVNASPTIRDSGKSGRSDDGSTFSSMPRWKSASQTAER